MSTRVLIVGAGPTGLVLACELARRGVPHRIVEKASRHFRGSRGKGLHPRTQEVFDHLGVMDAILAAGTHYPPFRVYRGAKALGQDRMAEHHEPTPDIPYPNAWLVPQWRTEQILRDRLVELGGRVELDTELVGIRQDADHVTAELVRQQGTEQVRVAYLVGADGGHSFVRQTLGIGFAGLTNGAQRLLVADVRVDGLDRENWHTWTNGDGTLGAALCPLPGTDLFQFAAPVRTDDAPSLALVRRVLDRAGAAVRVRDLSWVSLWRTNIRMVDRYRVGRVLLAGDAAHVHSPAGGQGLNTGVQDAHNLAWKLAHVLAGAPDTLLDTYERERLPIAAGVLGLSTRLHDKAVRGDADAHKRGPETQQLGLHYRTSPLSREKPGVSGALRAGDRAPDARCVSAAGDPVRLFDVFRGPHVTVLTFGETGSPRGTTVNLRAVARLGNPAGRLHSLLDSGGHARNAYGVQGHALVVVRPDGYVGLIHDAPGAVDDYLRSVVAVPR